MAVYVDNTEFVTELCCSCGIAFGMTKDFQRRRRDDHARFYCPSGHGQVYTGPTEAQNLRNELERSRELLETARQRAEAEAEQRRHVEKAHRRMRVRVMNGVCPCCNRTFQNLLNHMKTEHPDYVEKSSLRQLREIFGMTQNDVAREAGVNNVYVSLYERERPVPERAKRRLDSWAEHQNAKVTAS